MMTHEEIRELASFQADENSGAVALSFYFQPGPPQDRSHRGDTIVTKDLGKQALKEASGKGRNGWLHADLERVLEIAAGIQLDDAFAALGCDGLARRRELDVVRGVHDADGCQRQRGGRPGRVGH